MAGKKKKDQLPEPTDDQVEKITEDRRKLRAAQRFIMDIIERDGEAAVDINSSAFDNIRQKTNHVFEEREKIQTHITREHLNDAVIMRDLSHVVRKQAATLQNVSRLYSFEHFASCIKRDFRNEASPIGIDWVVLGDDVGSLYLPQAELNTMLGPISKQKKMRNAPVRKVKQDYVDIVPDAIINRNEDGDCDEATNERYKKLLDVSETMSSSGGKGEDVDRTYNLLSVLVNRDDNVQTVENLFDFAFAIKDKRVMMSYQDDPNFAAKMPSAIHQELGTKAIAENVRKRQMVLSVNMGELNELRRLLQEADKKGLSQEAADKARTLHRADSMYDRHLTAHQQANLIDERGKVKNRAATQATAGSDKKQKRTVASQ